jgi:hypothetical protein
MLKVCPSCHGIYKLKEVICPTCKAELVPRKGNEAATRPNYVKPDPVSYIWDMFVLILIAYLYLSGEGSIWMTIIFYSILSKYRENGIWIDK